jgi:hypothetical protein
MLIRKKIIEKYAVKILMKHAEMFNYDTNGGHNLFRKSIEQTTSIAPMYKNE